ncbi:molybdenum cofactor guanylyltransferase [Glycomyces harbinensis]|uniref:Molybdopterin-guanine dinucleotide biosynthesis protein A n=1 Tax=Glycomyces harbinensis TaxID=58114 RepID=A0A1G7DB55_9ACTN|nr:molybdenum cofactor guanylyltransferase [Glycomyces harbinensis]SDE47975.1 Molybdopterin-guanine dinucleotide biosynthesis protein A [Glycomyces harbinensis]
MAELPSSYAAIVLVGGKARRFAGCAKSELVVEGATILERMLSAIEDAAVRVVVGARPADAKPLPAGVLQILEDPPRSGPARSVAAGLALVPDHCDRVAILGGDLPFFTAEALDLLRGKASAAGAETGALFCDDAGRRQWLCGLWPAALIRRNAAGIEPGAPARRLFTGIEVETVHWDEASPPPWFDCDTPADLEQARSWAAELK